MSECNWPTCDRRAEPNGYCVSHRIYANSVSVKIKKEIPKESKKEKGLKRDRKKEYERFLAGHAYCMAKFSKDCQKVATVVHHLKGRTPAVVDDQRFWLACCPVCNNEIEARDLDARRMDLKLSQHKKIDTPITIGAHNLPYLCGVTPEADPEPEEGQVLVIDYRKSRAQVKKLLEQVKDDPNKYFIISKSEYVKKGVPLEKVATWYKDFLQVINCSLPQDFIDANL